MVENLPCKVKSFLALLHRNRLVLAGGPAARAHERSGCSPPLEVVVTRTRASRPRQIPPCLRLGTTVLLLVVARATPTGGETAPATTSRFTMASSGVELARAPVSGAFFDVAGRRSAFFGYELRGIEGWVYPLKVFDDFRLTFSLEGYPLDVPAHEIGVRTVVRPESTTFTYAHAAFTVRHTLFAPVDEPALVMLLDVDSRLPLTVTASFRPRLRPMWPAGLMTSNVSWDQASQTYSLGEESRRFAAIVGVPGGRDISLQPYQEEPRDVPLRVVIDTARRARGELIPIIATGSVTGAADARASYQRVAASIPALYEATVQHYRRLLHGTTLVTTPDDRLNAAFMWAKVGIDKGTVTNPMLGTGLVAGFRTSGDSERPGFAWFFGRDALWTALATTSYGDLATTRLALDFLRKHQRDDGKIPHEVSQSAALLPWFTDYPYAWASADATPLYIVVHADLFRAAGDREYLRASWESILEAYRFTAATDTDGNGLVENTKFGHGWVEGGALYPPHEEIYQQGVWVAAQLAIAELAEAMGDRAVAAAARAGAERARDAIEGTYWLEDRGFYAFGTQVPPAARKLAEPGPQLARRQARLDALATARLVDEDTVLPAVPLWWRVLAGDRADRQIDRLGSGRIATDWGARILSDRSQLYDPLSYHYGSVWPLFSGWTSMAAYRYGRPHVGYQALMATAHLTWDGALGYITELLSGDFNTPFGRSSHHQVWSEAMLATPLIRGLLGLEAGDAGARLTFAPQLPARWPRVSVENVAVGSARYDVSLERSPGRLVMQVARRAESPAPATPLRVTLAPAFPLDARPRSVTLDGRAVTPSIGRLGDVQRAEVSFELTGSSAKLVYVYDEGTEVDVDVPPGLPGAENEGLRVLRARSEGGVLKLLVEGRGGRTYTLRVRSPRGLEAIDGVQIDRVASGIAELSISFVGPATDYVRREVSLPLR